MSGTGETVLGEETRAQVWSGAAKALSCDPDAADAVMHWSVRAERLLDQALGEIRDGDDAIATVTAALAALRIEAGELAADEMDGFAFPGEDREDERVCICPPDLLQRGGFRSACLVHGVAREWSS